MVVGWQSSRVAAAAVEKRLIDDSVSNTARLIQELRLPLSDRLMSQLATVLNCEVIAVSLSNDRVLASSFPAGAETQELMATLPSDADEHPEWVRLPAGRYRVGAGVVSGTSPAAETSETARLLVLMPEARVRAAQQQAATQIGILTLIAAVAAVVIGVLLSNTLARPIGNLAHRMERVADEIAGADSVAALPPSANVSGISIGTRLPAHSASELKQLSTAFDHLLSQLKDSHVRLDRAARLAASGRMSAGVAHELRNPLSSIKMNARVLLDEPELTNESRQSVDLIFHEIDRMDLYLQELMALQPEDNNAGAQPAEGVASNPPEVHLNEVADSVLNLFQDRARRNGIHFVRNADAGQDIVAAADYASLRQVLMNLIVNALEASPRNSTIEVSIEKSQPGTARLTVTDHGPGISVELGDRIFDPFVTTKPRGTGLGLFICQQIIHRFGGEMGYDTSEDANRVWFEVPTA